jgi:hypothetical protein
MNPETIATPAAAVDALMAANRGNHIGKLLAIVGPAPKPPPTARSRSSRPSYRVAFDISRAPNPQHCPR